MGGHICYMSHIFKLGFSNYFVYRDLFKLFIQGATYFKPLHMALRLFMLLTLISGFWELIKDLLLLRWRR